MIRLERATVVSQEQVYENTYLMWLSCPPVAKGASPGRFLMVRCSDGNDPLLPRPMSFHRFRRQPSPEGQALSRQPSPGGQALSLTGERGGAQPATQFAILYDVRGRGTAWLSTRKSGDAIRVFGPLGRGYSLSPAAQNVLLVAGGLGVAAVVALADEAIAAGKAVTLLQGARTVARLFPAHLLPTAVEAVSATDDGSEGHHGYVTEILPGYLPWADQVFACGPGPMFAAMANTMRQARSRKPVQALLEEHMGCGTGVCYGCAVFTRKGVRLVCRDGPRFELREVFT
ncbi:MAG: dihydroorotate dehydrogenase electron transfer subunit [Dehalococcoidia bacterium]|nr:dihydroorotate dehydrogenase electron transfer subunit [Dehalococcoidia bacterium]